jgi:hypothetical protein
MLPRLRTAASTRRQSPTTETRTILTEVCHVHDYDSRWRCKVPGCGYKLPAHLHRDRSVGKMEQRISER